MALKDFAGARNTLRKIIDLHAEQDKTLLKLAKAIWLMEHIPEYSKLAQTEKLKLSVKVKLYTHTQVPENAKLVVTMDPSGNVYELPLRDVPAALWPENMATRGHVTSRDAQIYDALRRKQFRTGPPLFPDQEGD